jgi:hypothetical protein
MNGLFSAAPCASSIRLLAGAHLLLLVQSVLVLWSAPLTGAGKVLVWLTLLIGIAAFLCAVRGEAAGRQPWWKARSKERRRGR